MAKTDYDLKGRTLRTPEQGTWPMKFAKWVFLSAGLLGIAMVLPLYLLEEKFSRDNPPPINHPEFYYGFVGVTLAWQWMFLVIGSDPVRFRKAMLPSMLEKASFAVAIPILFTYQRVSAMWIGIASIDAVWLLLFIAAYSRTPRISPGAQTTG
jgi:hypothetical protein